MSISEPVLLYILLSPLLGAVVVGLFGSILQRWFPNRLAEVIACGAILSAFALTIVAAIHRGAAEASLHFILLNQWLPFGTSADQSINVALYMDEVTQLMLLLITGVGFLIHLFSVGYMHDDSDRRRYFAYLNLFVFFMLMLVLSNSLLTLFVGWEGVGLCSYLLIGFWFKDQKNAIAGKKAFIVNRIGDAGFILGMLTLLTQFGSLDVHTLAGSGQGLMDLVKEPSCWITMATLLLFVGAVGKSAQFPLLIWLPDAMAGPTPVSALIHAATMVTAGVYMIIRLNFVFLLAPTTMEIISIVGLITALFAACAAMGQRDIKRVLAYSTVSQLGYMFLGLGVGAFSASMFHLITHGFFKALLFLSAGSVIHGTHGEQDMYRMGGLKNYMIPTTICFGIGSLALSGFPLLSGWFSKGAILSACYAGGHYIYWTVGVLTAVITACYTIKLFTTVFLGTPNLPKEALAITTNHTQQSQ
jgi:NADH-quinone oxidoreductase subunit L